jgi:hypothetical protein
MADPIFTNEPAPAVPPKKRMSTAAKLAIGCGLVFVLGLGTCMGGFLFCGSAITSAGKEQWADLRAVASDAMTDAGAKHAYQAHPGLAQAYPTEDDFVGATRLWRPDLSELPEGMPQMFSGPNKGRIAVNTQYVNGESKVVLAYHLDSGKSLIGTWKNKQLVDLQLE